MLLFRFPWYRLQYFLIKSFESYILSLLDLNNVPGGQISGLNDEELQWITSETFDRYLYELSDDFVRSLEEHARE